MELTKVPEFKPVFEAGKKQTVATEYKGVPVYIVPDDMKVHTLENLVEQQLERPYKLKQKIELLSAESFIEYYNRYAIESSTIFVDITNGKFTAVLDYHDSPNEAAWKLHTATYDCPLTKEWTNWQHYNNDKMSQEDFALFIEDNLREIMEPDGAQMLEIAASLKAKTNVDFKQSVRLDNGQTQFTYSETIDGQAGVTGQLQIPEKIKLAIKPLQSGAPYECEARFRYRITQQGLVMWYTLIRPHLIQEDAVNDVFNKIKEEMSTGHIVQARY